METKRLYYQDSYLRDFEARVIDATEGGRRLYLDQTAFYPTSGGQPFDLGRLGNSNVLEVLDEGDCIAHIVDRPVEVGNLQGEIAWQRRYDHMQQHTGQHLLSAVFLHAFGIPTLSFHMGGDSSSIELQIPALTEDQISLAEERVNFLARQVIPVHITFEHASSVEGLRKPSQLSGTLRIVEIEGHDRSACGGTHVQSTAEVSPIQLRRTERVRGNTRLEFVCGIRALKRAHEDFAILSDLAKQSSSSFDKLSERMHSLRARLAEAEKQAEVLASELSRQEGIAWFERTVPSADGVRRALLQVDTLDQGERARAQAYAGQGSAIVLVICENPAGVIAACSTDVGLHLGQILKSFLLEAGGRGGGSQTLAQGSLPSLESLDRLKRALGFAESDR